MKPGFVGKARRRGEGGEERPEYFVWSWQVYRIHPRSLGEIPLLGGHLLELFGEFRVRDLHSLGEIFDVAGIRDAGQGVPKKR